jgi:hypothetical protein
MRVCNSMNRVDSLRPSDIFDSHRPLHSQPSPANASQQTLDNAAVAMFACLGFRWLPYHTQRYIAVTSNVGFVSEADVELQRRFRVPGHSWGEC